MSDLEHGEENSPFGGLPQEILDHILSYLDSAAPSSSRVHDQPTFNITAGDGMLKAVSTICRRWRRATIQRLFRHTRVRLHQLDSSTQTICDFMLHFIEKNNLQRNIESFVLCIKDHVPLEADVDFFQLPEFWSRLFEVTNPSEVIIVAHPEDLGRLVGYNAQSDDHWMFEMDFHILRLQQAPSTDPPSKPDVYANQVLFDARPWTSILLNEGSFIKGFHQYEYHHRQPASILVRLLGTGFTSIDGERNEIDRGLVLPCTKEFSYIAVFPTQTHFGYVTAHLPKVDKLYVQLTPRPGDEILQDRELMQRIDGRDLWMERNHCYTMIMRELFDTPPGGNFKHLKEFESGDAADEDAWNMAVQFVERQGGWVVESPGVFVRKAEGKTDDGLGALLV